MAQLRNGQDAALVLGAVSTVPLPSRRGKALVTTPSGTRAVRLDLLDDGAWTALCARATALRTTGSDDGGAAVLEPLTPCQTAAYELLHVTPDGLSADVLRSLLPDDVRPASAARLGRELSPRPDRFEQVKSRDGRRWVAVTPAVTEPCAAVTEPSAPVTDTPAERAGQQPHPRMPPLTVLPSQPLLRLPERMPSRTELQASTTTPTEGDDT